MIFLLEKIFFPKIRYTIYSKELWFEFRRKETNMIDITPSIRKRFCKDFNLPIALFDEPYFSERLAVVDKVIPCLSDWENFVSELRSFQME